MEQQTVPQEIQADAKASGQFRLEDVLASHRKDTEAVTRSFSAIAKQELSRQVQKAKDAKKIIGKGTSSQALALSSQQMCLVPGQKDSDRELQDKAQAEIKKYQALRRAGVSSPFLQSHIMIDSAMRKVSLRGKYGDLHKHLQTLAGIGKKLTGAQAAEISFETFLGMQEMHRCGLAMLDIKPKNLIVLVKDFFYFVQHIDLDFLDVTRLDTTSSYSVTLPFLPPAVKHQNASGKTIVYAWAIAAHPQLMDLYAFRKTVEIILKHTEEPSKWLNKIADFPSYYENLFCFNQETLDQENAQIKKYFTKIFGDFDHWKNNKVIKAQAFIDEQMKGFYRTDKEAEGLTDPLQAAPEEIRDFQFFYERLRNQEHAFLNSVTEDSWQMLASVIKQTATVAQLAFKRNHLAHDPYRPALKQALAGLLLDETTPFILNVKGIMSEYELLLKNEGMFPVSELGKNLRNESENVESLRKAHQELAEAKQQLLIRVRKSLEQITQLLSAKMSDSNLFEKRCGQALLTSIAVLKMYEEELLRQIGLFPKLDRVTESLMALAAIPKLSRRHSADSSMMRGPVPEAKKPSFAFFRLGSSSLFSPSPKTSAPSPLKQKRLELLAGRARSNSAPSLEMPTTINADCYESIICLK